MALLKEITGPDNLKAINTAADSLDDKESVALAQAASAGIARLEAIRYRALAQLNRHREGARSVAQEVAFALSVGDKYAAGLVAAADAVTTRPPRTLGLMDLFTYLGLNDDPAEMAGHGHIPASPGRHIAGGPETVLRRIVTDPLSGQSHRSRPGPVSPDNRSGRVRPGAGS